MRALEKRASCTSWVSRELLPAAGSWGSLWGERVGMASAQRLPAASLPEEHILSSAEGHPNQSPLPGLSTVLFIAC